MNTVEIIQAISTKEVDVGRFVRLVIDNENVRNEVVRQMLTNPDIMVYYHCYYVVSDASEERPDLFFTYWDEIATLLKHKNSYHGDIALTNLANLTKVDQNNRFSEIFEDYFEHFNDQKFMTAQCCVRNSLKIIKNVPELKNRIVDLLLDVDNRCLYPEKQKELLKCDVLEVLDSVYPDIYDTKQVNEFINAVTNSISPKTRRKAKELVKKYTTDVTPL